jgi:hypothetical protein
MLSEKQVEVKSEALFTYHKNLAPRIVARLTIRESLPEWERNLFIGFALKSQAERFCKLAYKRGYAAAPTFSEPTVLSGKGFRWEVQLLGASRNMMNKLAALDKQDVLAEQAMAEFLQESVTKGLISRPEATKLLHSMRSKGALFR